MISDASTDFCQRIRYCIQIVDNNCTRVPAHEHWRCTRNVALAASS